jgi:ribulose-phosphate 3-epimerase
MIEIIPAILSKTAADYHRKLKTVEPFTEWVQIDIVDNQYARNQTVGPKEVGSIRTRLKMEIQLMVERIDNWLDPFLEVNPARIVFPIETASDPMRLVRHMKNHGIPFGFSLEPRTGIERIVHLIYDVDLILLLAVQPGFSGQHFAFNTINKIKKLKSLRPELEIEIDGGIEPGTARKCAQAGATKLVAGSFVFENDKMYGATYSEKVRNSIETLKEAVADVIPENLI